MFFPQDAAHFTGFDPATNALTQLTFDDNGGARFTLADGQRIEARR